MGRFLAETILPLLIAPVYFLLRLTWRIKESGPAHVLEKHVYRSGPSAPCLYAHWHGDELVLVGYYSYRRLAVLASLSKDGTIMARTLRMLGYKVFRGSSSKGGARGLIGLIRAVKEGSQASLAVDGPKGPIYEVKPGILELARKTGMPIVPLRTRAESAWYVPRAWNKSYLPKPFSRVLVDYAEPILAGPHDDIAALAGLVTARLDALPGQYPAPSRT